MNKLLNTKSVWEFIFKLEEELIKKLQVWQPELVTLVNSITVIGKRATSLFGITSDSVAQKE